MSQQESKAGLLVRVQQALGMSQEEIGELLHVSRRTINRWVAGGGWIMTPQEAPTVLGTIHAADPDLAQRVAAAFGYPLEGLGIVRKKPDIRHLADSVVCAAADAGGASTHTMRPALLAGFQRAGELGLSYEDMVKTLTAPGKRPLRALGKG